MNSREPDTKPVVFQTILPCSLISPSFLRNRYTPIECFKSFAPAKHQTIFFVKFCSVDTQMIGLQCTEWILQHEFISSD